MASTSAEMTTEVPFSSMNLDERLLEAISDLGWQKPTLIQEKSIPLALEGRDVSARARTGSGKSAVFLLPVLHKLLELKELTKYCRKDVVVLDLGKADDGTNLRSLPRGVDIVIGTPSRSLAYVKDDPLTLESLQSLVIDEADMVLSLGFEEDIRGLVKYIPKTCQSFLTSATLNQEVALLKKLVMHNPVTLKLEEATLPTQSQLTQYYVKCAPDDKFLLLYALLKLQLIRGKTIIFVNDVDRCYRVKLFLQQFSIPTCVLNSELPASSRTHVINQFNNGEYSYVVASDEKDVDQVCRKKGKRKRDDESGVSRGIDFHNVSNVINFDFPISADSYIHRIGRTARAFNQGTALSFAAPAEQKMLDGVCTVIDQHLSSTEVIKPYQFDMNDLEGFRYRATDALKAVTRSAVREARIEEIKREILTSTKLKKFLAKNPRDLRVLRHDAPLHAVRAQPHLRHVPDYIVPPTLRGQAQQANDDAASQRRGKRSRKPKAGVPQKQKKQSNPLKSFDLDDSD